MFHLSLTACAAICTGIVMKGLLLSSYPETCLYGRKLHEIYNQSMSYSSSSKNIPVIGEIVLVYRLSLLSFITGYPRFFYQIKSVLTIYFHKLLDNTENIEDFILAYIWNVLCIIVAAIYCATTGALFIQWQMESVRATIWLIGCLVIAVVLAYIPIDDLKQQREQRIKEMEKELPKAITALIFMLNAGMQLEPAFTTVFSIPYNYFYWQMWRISKALFVGEDFQTSSRNVLSYYDSNELQQFIRILNLAYRRGGSGYLQQLEQLRSTILLAELNNYRRLGDQINAQLLIPLLLSFLGIILMIVGPIFLSIML